MFSFWKHKYNYVYTRVAPITCLLWRQVDQPDLGMPSRDYYLKGRNDTTLLAYETKLREIMVALGVEEATARQDAVDIVDMEIQLANVRWINTFLNSVAKQVILTYINHCSLQMESISYFEQDLKGKRSQIYHYNSDRLALSN